MISIALFIPWFEAKLRDCLEIDLEHINYELHQFKTKFDNLCILSSNLRSIINSTASQPLSQKILKFSENLSLLFSSHNIKLAVLPDSEYINDLIQVFRIKLRSVDEMNTYGKNSRKESTADKILYKIKMLVDSSLSTLDRLEYAHSNQFLLTTYLSDIKVNIFKPLVEQLDQFNVLSSKISSYNSHDSEEVMREAIALHQSIGSSDILQYVQLQHEEAQYIEVKIHDMITPLREAIRSLRENCKKNDDMGCYQIVTSLLLVSEDEFFTLCRNKSTIDQLSSALWEIRSSAASSSSSSSTITTTMSTDNNDSPDSQRTRSTTTTTTVTTVTTTSPRPSPDRPSQLPSSESSHSDVKVWNMVVSALQSGVTNTLDVELFLAYLEDWNLRIDSIDRLTATTEFSQKYRSLEQSRTQLQLAKESYEKLVEEISSDKLALNEILIQLGNYSDTLKELCLEELKIEVEIDFPCRENLLPSHPSTSTLHDSCENIDSGTSAEDSLLYRH